MTRVIRANEPTALIGWLPLTEWAPGWERQDRFGGYPACAHRGAGGHIEVRFDAIKNGDPNAAAVEGERVVRVPAEILGDDWQRRVSTVTIQSANQRWVEEHEIDDDGWFLAPRIVVPKHPAALRL